MVDDISDSSQKSVGKSIGTDVYVEIKGWIKRQDTNGNKLNAYRKGIKESLGSIQIMGMQNPRPLETIYIGLKAIPNIKKATVNRKSIFSDNQAATPDLPEFRESSEFSFDVDSFLDEIGYGYLTEISEDFESAHDYAVATEDYFKEISGIFKSSHGIDAIEIVDENQRILILGQPGSGKTTFLKYLSLAYLGFVPVPKPMEPLLPIYVPLRELQRIEDPSPNAQWIYKLVLNCACDFSNASHSKEWIAEKLDSGGCIILLDGIDEILSQNSKAIIQSISSFSKRYLNNKIIVTCRTKILESGLEGFQTCEIEDFSSDDVARFSEHWFGDEQRKRDAFLDEVRDSRSCEDLCRTPLLLTLLCIAYDFNRNIPENRTELYESCVDALMFRWDTYRSIERPLIGKSLSPAKKKSILSRIARKFFDEHKYIFERRYLMSEITSELLKIDAEHIDPEDFLIEIEVHHGFFIERARDLYSFSHLSFHEYFACMSYVGANQVDSLIQNVLQSERYREVFIMCIEKMYDPNRTISWLAGAIKREFIDGRKYSRYTYQLIDGISRSHALMHPKIRRLAKEISVDLQLIEADDESYDDDIYV